MGHLSGYPIISYDHGTLHLQASGARADNAATEIPAKPHTHEQETHRIHASINTIYPTPSIATHTHPTHR